jgi:hypothetical protein
MKFRTLVLLTLMENSFDSETKEKISPRSHQTKSCQAATHTFCIASAMKNFKNLSKSLIRFSRYSKMGPIKSRVLIHSAGLVNLSTDEPSERILTKNTTITKSLF